MIRTKQTGFTIVELMIATAVFAVILLVATGAIIQISRAYFKGRTTTQMQEAARSVTAAASEALQFGGSEFTAITEVNGTKGYCIGSTRFSYVPFKLLQDNQYGLVIDKINTGQQCESGLPAHDLNAASPAVEDDWQEFLIPRMRVLEFNITKLDNNLYKVSVALAIGENDLFEDVSAPAGFDAGDKPYRCKTQIGSQFCAVTSLSTIVQRRVQ